MEKDYEEQLKIKREYVRKLYSGHDVEPVIGMKDPYHYRHKVYAAFSTNRNGNIRAAMYEENSHRPVIVNNCLIQNEAANRIIETICRTAEEMNIEVYNEDTGTGVLRHAYIRISRSTKRALVTIVIGAKQMPGSRKFVAVLTKKHPEIETVIINQNSRKTSMVLGEKEHVVYGKGFITEEISGLKFRISSKSFFQVNPVQAEKLYRTAINMAKLNMESVVLDACCGTGTIALLAAKYAKNVIGVEISESSVRDARYNAKVNHIGNAQFYCNDAEQFMHSLDEKIDCVFLDPPRSGMTYSFMSELKRLEPEKIVYISCNPETQVRDLRILKNYTIKKIVPCDMFPMTPHLETIVLLQKLNS